MPDHRQERIKELFQAAAQRRPAERSAYLQAECGGDADLRSAVESLLAAGDDAGSFLERPPLLSPGGLVPGSLVPGSLDAGGSATSGTTRTSAPAFGAAQVIDRYRLLEKLGEGGMGEVWLAEQQQPVRRGVALKVIKAGMDTAQVISRFEAERQALAMMDHPAIAKVFDAGATSAGRPYFVMEHVPGLPITQHCDRQRLGISERLELFIQVCEGVQHAHQKAVLHRDLKPSNILVASHDGRAVPKIIDFGVAKAMARPLTGHTLHTGLGVLIGTPGYMSPEQADLSGRDVDTRTDVYSLGVMLYELLVGVLPFDSQKLRQAGWEGLGKLLRDTAPATPSRRLNTLPPAASAESAGRRQADTPGLRRRLTGDLDRITMKAIESDRERRYRSPSDLAEDIRRHLRDEPVLAGSPGAAYRMRKFVLRHRLGVAAASIVTLAVAAGLVGTTLGLVRARRAEKEAVKQAETSERVSGFLSGLLSSVDPARMGTTLVADLRQRVDKAERARGGDEAQVAATLAAFDRAMGEVSHVDTARSLMDREILARAGRTIDEEMSSDPLLAARLQATLGSAYHELGLFVTAAAFHLKALETRRRLLGPEHADTLRSMTDLGRAYSSGGRAGDAEQVLEEAVATQRRVLGPEHPDTLSSMNHLGFAKNFAGKVPEAEEIYRRTLEIRRRILGPEHPDTTNTMRFLADNLVMQGRHAEAEPLYLEALAIQRRVLGPEHTETLRSMGNRARALTGLGRHEESERVSLEVIDIRRRLSGDDNILTILSLGYLGTGYAEEGRTSDAERVLTDALERARRSEAPLVTPLIEWPLAGLLHQKGRLREAEALYREALEITQRNSNDVWRQNHLLALAHVVRQQGRLQEAEPLYRDVLEIRIRTLGEEHPLTQFAQRSLALLYWDSKDVERGRPYVESYLATIGRAAERPDATPDAKNHYAAWLVLCQPTDLRDPEKAMPFALAAVAGSERKEPEFLDTLALAYHFTGQHEDAVNTQREALAKLPPGPSPQREELEQNMRLIEKAALRR